jgi:hypothetical protein
MPLATLVLLSTSTSAQDKKVPPADGLQRKAVFKGTREFIKGPHKGTTVEAELRIISRKGTEFSGTAIFAGRNSVDVKGTVKDGNIEWKERYRAGNPIPTAVKGVLKDGKLILSFKGSNPADGVYMEGNMTLELEEKAK